MANVNIKFNGKEFLLSCDDGQEEHLEELSIHLNEKFTKLKLKAYEIDRLSCDVKCNPQEETTAMGKGKACAKKGKILICNKSDCAKRGGKKLYGVLEKTISNLGLEKHVTIQKTGCQKRCGNAPNMILMPGRSKHSKPNPKNIAGLLEEHYITSGKK